MPNLYFMGKYLLSLLIIFLLSSCNGSDVNNEQSENNPSPPFLTYNIVRVYPHDTTSYTEGLVWQNNALYESTGNNGKSKLLRIKPETGMPEQEVKLDSIYFGEGISLFNNKVYQLTWRDHKVFVYDPNNFKKIKEMSWPYEGWGITHNDKELIISTGTSVLYFVNPDDFKIIRTVSVTDNYGPVSNINELEYVNGFIYSNKYLSNNILKIDPETGKVLGKADFTGILNKSGTPYDPAKYDLDSGNVLNGIAYNAANNSFYVTGKYWPALFEIKFN